MERKLPEEIKCQLLDSFGGAMRRGSRPLITVPSSFLHHNRGVIVRETLLNFCQIPARGCVCKTCRFIDPLGPCNDESSDWLSTRWWGAECVPRGEESQTILPPCPHYYIHRLIPHCWYLVLHYHITPELCPSFAYVIIKTPLRSITKWTVNRRRTFILCSWSEGCQNGRDEVANGREAVDWLNLSTELT